MSQIDLHEVATFQNKTEYLAAFEKISQRCSWQGQNSYSAFFCEKAVMPAKSIYH